VTEPITKPSVEVGAKGPLAPTAQKQKSSELERCFAEALEREQAIDEILRVMTSSPGEVQLVMDAVAKWTARLCEVPFVRVLLVDGDTLRAVAAHSLDGSAASEIPVPLKRTSISGRAVLDRVTVHYGDVVPLLDTEYPDATNARALAIRAVLIVPLMREGNAYGAITVFRREPGLFSSEQVALVERFARQAAIAIDHARLFKETKEALDQQIATSEILRVIASSPGDVQPMLSAVVERAAKLCEAANATIYVAQGDKYRSTARFGSAPRPRELELGEDMPLTRGSAVGRAIIEGTTIHLEDLAVLAEEEYPIARRWQRIVGHRTLLAVPLMRNDRAIGAISLWRMEVWPFTEKQISLVKTFADQAAIAIENVRLFNETKQALERQTATSEILGVISQSPRDVQPVFDSIVKNAVQLCEARFGAVFRLERGLVHLAAHHNLSETWLAQWFQPFYPMAPNRGHVSGRAILEGAAVQVPDILADKEYLGAGVKAVGFRSLLGVPLLRDGHAIGVIVIYRAEPGRFADNHLELLDTFADQAVIAIENVRLFTELEARTAELTRSVQELKALGEVGQAVSSTLDLETVLATIVSRAAQLAGMDAGAIYEYDEARREFYLHTADRLEDEVVTALRAGPIRQGEGALGRMAMTGEPAQIRDIMTDASYQSRLRDTVLRLGYRSLMAVPLMRDDHLLGGLVVYRKTAGDFDAPLINLLKTFATQSALAIQNARLFREIEVKSRELEAASRHKSEFLANMSHELRTPLNAIIGFSEVLSERMFGEINEKQAEYIDDILHSGQHLLSLINDILDLSKIEAGRMELELSEFDLPSTIENTLTLVRERAMRRGIELGRIVDERLGIIRADERKVKQVLLNLLSNALKFTPEGGKITVSAGVQDGVAEISVADTGVGIEPEYQETVFEEFRQVGTASKKVEGTGLGLAISRKFIELHGGKIWVRSQIGSGSTFAFTLPLR